MANRYGVVGRLLYGPLAPLLSKQGQSLLTCFVMTKIGGDSKRVVYAGYPTEINLKDGSNIDHVVIENPGKFYVDMTDPALKSSYERSRQMSTDVDGHSLLYISGDDIENVHFEGWYY